MKARRSPADEQRDRNAQRPERGPLFPIEVPWNAVLVFIAISFGLAWLIILPLWQEGGLLAPEFLPLSRLMMFTPAVGVLVVVLFMGRPPSIPRRLGLSPGRPWRRTLGMFLLASSVFLMLPVGAIFIGQALGLVQLDLENFSYAEEHYKVLYAELYAEGYEESLDAIPIANFVAMQFIMLPLIAVQAAVAAFGEELGFRGWLIPALRPLGVWPALLVSGGLWGLWYAPIVLLGYNYQRPDALGLFSMVVWAMLVGILLGWTRLRTTSIWPAVFAHGSISAAMSTALLLTAAGQEPREIVWGTFLGWPGLLLMGALVAVLVVSGAWKKEPAPGLTLDETLEKRAS